MLRMWSEPVSAMGSVTATGVRNALGRPTIELPNLLVREAIQNSWDARLGDGRAIRFEVGYSRLESARLAKLTAELIGDRGSPPGLNLDELLTATTLSVLTVSDRGTIGLAGPTRADLASDGPRNFINFVRNVGRTPDGHLRGGTYGYGKSVFYRISHLSTVVVHSRSHEPGGLTSRLIIAALGDPFVSDNRHFTGRHWWGAEPPGGVDLEPLTGGDAEAMADWLGLPPFVGAETGTTIAVLEPDLGRDSREAIATMAESAVWYCWPRLIGDRNAPEMTVTFTHLDEPVPVPDPASHPELSHFVRALRALDGEDTALTIVDIESRRPIQHLGRLAIRQFANLQPASTGPARPFTGPPRHVALLRHPRLVVRYLDAAAAPVPDVAWAGVFLANEAIDASFAAAEPPSHDDWNPQALESRSTSRSHVTVALNRIQEAVERFARPPDPIGGQATHPLGALSDALGGLLVGSGGPRPDDNRGSTGGDGGQGSGGRRERGEGRRSRTSIDVLGPGRLVLYRGQRAVRIDFSVTAPVELRAVASVAINDGTHLEREAPMMAAVPTVLAWEFGDRTPRMGPTVAVGGQGATEGSLYVSVPEDAAVAVDLSVIA